MKFGPVPPSRAEGCLLAHSLRLSERVLKKGTMLSAVDVAAMTAGGVETVTVARLEPGDIDENSAAARIAAPLTAPGLAITAPFAGRVNLVARRAGVVTLDAAAIGALNAIDEGITLATLPDQTWVAEGTLVATIKIIPYALPEALVALAEARAQGGCGLRLHPAVLKAADLVLTRTEGMKDSLIEKAEAVTEARLRALGVRLASVAVVRHEAQAVADALAGCRSGLILVFGGSATSDRDDVVPAGLIAAGGRLDRFGMPVDPGNLLCLGELRQRPVVGLPGCARSPALNGADWVLERLVSGQSVTGADIAAMGVGGLLKEIPQRRQPRTARPASRTRVELLLLAAGASRRMAGADKLLRQIDGVPLLRRSAEIALASGVARVRVLLPSGATARRAVLDGLDVEIVEVPDCDEGMAASIRAGVRAVEAGTAAVVVMPADMPDIAPGHIDRLIAAHDPAEDREICRAVAADGTPGHPVLFGQRFFEPLMGLAGDHGARDVIASAPEYLTLVPTPGCGALTDLDTPEAWAEWERKLDR